ncbi:hypothetical protein ECANGB1_1049 [Enterospora canceri]|uniref:Uncharacterized protein n=1 Tax=Enterospora canceri TaxID=1081671 RepID=A0A1Y1S7J6_9MICR|nr:hypothetical protein ECANGB1_1049 [Enterospora canceri]
MVKKRVGSENQIYQDLERFLGLPISHDINKHPFILNSILHTILLCTITSILYLNIYQQTNNKTKRTIHFDK